MDKNEFLSELEKSLSVLQEDELKDIISEYEQHIDIKVEKGLTEEEAIADFGSLQELTAEILEAYHVRVDYAAKAGRSRKKGKNSEQENGESFEKLKQIKEKGSIKIWNSMKNAAAWIVNSIRWGWKQLCRPFAWIHSFAVTHNPWQEAEDRKRIETLTGDEPWEPDIAEEYRQSERNIAVSRERKDGRYISGRKEDRKMTGMAIRRDEKRIMGKGIQTIGRGIGKMFQWVMETALWGIRLVWNGCWILFSLFAGGFGLFSLFIIGLLIVLLIEGYPLAGVTIGCLGMVFCMFSAAGLGMTFLWRKNKKTSAAGEGEGLWETAGNQIQERTEDGENA